MKDLVSEKPLVSIYIPTYNRVELLKRAVQSVLAQDYNNLELIVVDDRSTDNTVDYLSQMSKQDSRLKYLVNDSNSGACVSRNRAIFTAKGQFITGLDDDDYFLPDRISSFINRWNNIIKTDNDCVALYSNNFVKMLVTHQLLIKRKYSCTNKDLICSNSIGNQIFTKTEYLRAIGGFDDNLPIWQDLECWYRLLDFYQSRAYITDVYSYVVDVSHPHERITTKKASSAIRAYKFICQKHELSYNQSKILELQLIPYTNTLPSLNSIVRRLAFVPDYRNTRSTLSVIYNSLKKKLKK